MTEYRLFPRTAFGAESAHSVSIAGVTLTERPDVALASVAARTGEAEIAGTMAELCGGPCGVGQYKEGAPFSTFWSGPDQWFVLADHAAHETLAAELQARLGDRASVTEQNDGWVVFDLTGNALTPMLERLCNIDLARFEAGQAQRCVIEHISSFVLCRDPGLSYRLMCGRSFARSFAHAVETIMASVAAQAAA
ncbi:sarcosine oxidase subunit gamma [Leisingera sp. ANG59]|uniref:sarcosine oxidase subunit gamma n=1 Tax=Leisingera sp. ANG59 TaxID=2675221 RepID=UPI0015745399|nr:sarcosine oxidase subunit gamma [Leisingera sp. ANG59]NSY39337.1 sarcosine oxidase subunit gamma [Leisingera sp. ANG59]